MLLFPSETAYNTTELCSNVQFCVVGFQSQSYAKEMVLIGQITVELAFILGEEQNQIFSNPLLHVVFTVLFFALRSS